MATGRSTQITKQAGEYLVAAELCRKGFIATTFTGNVPHYDILASDSCGRHVTVQVKAIRGGSWQFDLRKFIDVTMDGDRQILGEPAPAPFPNLVFVFVVLGDYGQDRFFVLTWEDLRAAVLTGAREFLEKHDYVRPKKPESFHTALWPQTIEQFKDNWELIERMLAGG